MHQPVCHLMCGLPGAGKTTLARRIEAETGAVRFSPDEWLLALGIDGHDQHARGRVEQLQWTIAQDLLKRGIGVVLENGFWGRAERDAYRRTAALCGATTRVHYLDVPLPELKRRIVQRNEKPGTGHFLLDPYDLDSWAGLFEVPDAIELAYPQGEKG